MIAYHFPPIQASSGIHRTVSFCGAMARGGWETTVMTVTRGALTSRRDENESLVPEGVNVLRAPALDTTRHLAIAGKYPGFLARPDRWISWLPAGVVLGLAQILRRRPGIIYSTYPIATAHLIGFALHRLTGIPWIADFRDPMAQQDYPSDPVLWKSFKQIEALAMKHAARVLFAAPGAAHYYSEHYPEAVQHRGTVIENGFDEEMFVRVEARRGGVERRRGPLKFLHSGLLYPKERNPQAFFRAIASLKEEGVVREGDIEFILRGSGHEDVYSRTVVEMGINDLVRLEPPVSYEEAIDEMLQADALMLFQSSGCNFQIPAKMYEYFRARRPVVAFTDPAGDTAQALRAAGLDSIAQLDSAPEIRGVLSSAIMSLQHDRDARAGSTEHVERCTREARAEHFREVVSDVLRSNSR